MLHWKHIIHTIITIRGVGWVKRCYAWIDKYEENDTNPDNKVHGANIRPTWVLSAPDGPHVGPMSLAIRECLPGSISCKASVSTTVRWKEHYNDVIWASKYRQINCLFKSTLMLTPKKTSKLPVCNQLLITQSVCEWVCILVHYLICSWTLVIFCYHSWHHITHAEFNWYFFKCHL